MLPLDVALRSADPRAQTMARILDLLTMLVPSNLALFYAVNGRLEKYAVGPIVARVKHSRPPDLEHTLRAYREYLAPYDPFAPHRFAEHAIRLVTAEDLGGQQQFSRSRYAIELASRFSLMPVANLYLRHTGQTVGGIALAREPGLPELSPSETAVLRTAQPLFEHSYAMACERGPAPAHGDPLQHNGLTAREREIVALIARGASNDEIARALQIARSTVKTHIRHAFAKLGVANRRQAAMLFAATRPVS